MLAPLVHSAWLSLFTWDGVTPGTWNGLGNYSAIVSDPKIRSAFLHALILVAFYAVGPIAIGLLLAAAMSRTRVRGLALFRTVLFLPQVIALVVVAVMWRMIYEPDGGLLNEGLRAIGLGGLTQNWLGSFSLALPSVGLIGTWVMYGLAMVLFTAGVQKIPQSLYDAARMDGAGPVREFFAVTLPGLRNEIAVALTLTTIQALRSFDLVYITTGGGPGDATTVPAFEVYNRAFRGGDVGTASAIGVCIAALIFVLTLVINRSPSGRRRDDRPPRAGAHLRAAGRVLDHRARADRRHPADRAAGAGRRWRTSAQPNGLHVANFSKAWSDGHFSQYLRSSAIVVVAVVVISGLLSILAGYAFGMMRFRGDQALFYLFLLGLMVPLESTVVPLYYDFRDLGLTDTYAALILPQAGVSLAFGTFWMRAFFRSVPRSLVEAARLDGSSSWSTLWRVVLPLGRPAVLTMTVLVFMWTWNEFLLALVMVTEREAADGAARARVLLRPQHDRLRAARRGLGDRRDAGRARLRLPPAPLHPRDAVRGGQGLMAARRASTA